MESRNSKEALKREADEWVKHAKKDAALFRKFFKRTNSKTEVKKKTSWFQKCYNYFL